MRPRRAAARGPLLAVVVLLVVAVVVGMTGGTALALVPACRGGSVAAGTPRSEPVGERLLLMLSVLDWRRCGAALERRAAPAA